MEEATAIPPHNSKTGNHTGTTTIIHPGRNPNRGDHKCPQHATTQPSPGSDTPKFTNTNTHMTAPIQQQ